MSARAEAAVVDILPQHFAFLIAINVVWGMNLIASKVGTTHFPPMLFTVMRFGLLSLCLLPFLRWHASQMANVFKAGLLTGGLSFVALFAGLRISGDASTVAIASQLSVPFQTLLSVWLLGEVIHWRRRLGIALAFGGVVLIGFEPRVFHYLPGLGLVIASAFFGALGFVYIKRLHNVPAIHVQAWVSMLTWPLALVMSSIFESGQVAAITHANAAGWMALAYTIIGGSLFGHTGWYYLLSRYPVTRVAPLTLLSPLFSILFGVLLLHDQLTARMWFGGAVTLLGVFIVTVRERRLVDTGT